MNAHAPNIEPEAPPRSVRTIAIDALAGFVGELRKQEKIAETEKAAAAREFEEAVSAAKARRDERQAKADASLKEIRPTLAELEPTRARLAEQAAG